VVEASAAEAAVAGTAVTATKPAALKMRPTMTLREIFFIVVDSFGLGQVGPTSAGEVPTGPERHRLVAEPP
jgi:hypothetical protein